MKISEPQEGNCLCGSVSYRIEPPAELKDGIIWADQLVWMKGSDSAVECGRWRLCRHCGTTICCDWEGRIGLLSYLNLTVDALHESARAGRVERVRELLARGLPVDAEIQDSTPLMLAARKPHLEVCHVLLEHGANPKWVQTYHQARHRKRIPSLVKLLVLHGADPQKMLGRIVRAGLVDAVQSLLEAGADINRVDELGLLPLQSAADSSPRMLQLLIDQGAKKDVLGAGGGHALGFCARWGYTGKLRILLSAGFPVDLLQETPADTALFAACREGRIVCARLLLEHGANPNLGCEGITPLAAAAGHGSLALVELLLRYGADTEHQDSDGRTAGDYIQEPNVQGKHRRGINSAGEPTVAMPYGRGRWTLCQDALRSILKSTGTLGADIPRGFHSIEFRRCVDDDDLQVDSAIWKSAIRAGHAGCLEAQYLLGSHNAPISRPKLSGDWLRVAARAGHPEAVREAMMIGEATEQAHRQKLLEAAKLGSLEAMRDYAASSVDLDLPDRGHPEALPWYRRAALAGHREAQVAAGSMLIEGDGAPPDPATGLAFLEMAANSDDIDNAWSAASQLGHYHGGGRKIHGEPYLPPDPEKAEYWRARAAALRLEKDIWWDQFRGYISKRKTP